MKYAHATIIFIYLGAQVSCGNNREEVGTEGEGLNSTVASISVTRGNRSDALNTLSPQPFDHNSTSFLDIRGVGDSGWARSNQREPLRPAFGDYLDKFDPTGTSYRGDASFINWESVIGETCLKFKAPYKRGRMYSFVSHPDNVVQAIERGFNMINFATNHTRDCFDDGISNHGKGAKVSENMIIENMEQILSHDFKREVVWHGLGRTKKSKYAPKYITVTKNSSKIRIAFNAFYASDNYSCKFSNCLKDAKKILIELKKADADIRILSIHSQGQSGLQNLHNLGTQFIEQMNGDIVFGHGTHKWEAVRVIKKKKNGQGSGVLFEGMGNFLHPHLSLKNINYIARALFDPKTLKLTQIQVIPVRNEGGLYGGRVKFSKTSGKKVPANLTWKEIKDSNINNTSTGAVYSNI